MSDYTEHEGCIGRMHNRRKVARKEYNKLLEQAREIGTHLQEVGDHLQKVPWTNFLNTPAYPSVQEVIEMAAKIRALKAELESLDDALND